MTTPTLHGDASNGKLTPEYVTWQNIKQRVYDKNKDNYAWYGGRGIIVCERWRNSYPNFLADMGRKPSPQHSIERRDTNGNYCPENCYWATKLEQANNTRTNHYLTYQDKTLTFAEWSRETGLPYHAIKNRIRKGWSVERALTQPVRRGSARSTL